MERYERKGFWRPGMRRYWEEQKRCTNCEVFLRWSGHRILSSCRLMKHNFEVSTTEDLTIIFGIMFLFVAVVIRLLPWHCAGQWCSVQFCKQVISHDKKYTQLRLHHVWAWLYDKEKRYTTYQHCRVWLWIHSD
jgi:hypothetical protein